MHDGRGFRTRPPSGGEGAGTMDHEQAELLGRLSDALGPVPKSVLENAQSVFRENASRLPDADGDSEDAAVDRKDQVHENRTAHASPA